MVNSEDHMATRHYSELGIMTIMPSSAFSSYSRSENPHKMVSD